MQCKGKALASARQHWDVRQGGRGLRPADQAELAAAHLRHRLCPPRSRPCFRLPQVAPPVEDHSAGGFLKVLFLQYNISKEPESWKSENEQGQNNPVMEKVRTFLITLTPLMKHFMRKKLN